MDLYLDNFIPFSKNKPLLLRGLVAAMSGSREMTIEETDATKSTKGATSYGKNNYECTGIICTEGNQSANRDMLQYRDYLRRKYLAKRRYEV